MSPRAPYMQKRLDSMFQTRQVFGVPVWVPIAAVSIRLVVMAVGLAAMLTVGPPPGTLRGNAGPLLELQNRWDASWYVGIASGGYRRGAGGQFNNAAFFPAFPLTLRVVAMATKVPRTPEAWSWVGALLATAMFVTAMCYLYRLAGLTGDAQPGAAVMTVSLYPFGVFFGAGYTESLFLLSCLAALWHLSRGDRLTATLWGVVAGLTRPIGWLLVIPLFWTVAKHRRDLRAGDVVPVLSPAIGLLLFCAYLAVLTGNPLEWVSAQSRWGRHYVGVAGLAQDVLVRIQQPTDAVNAIAGVFALLCVVPVWRAYGWGFGLFVALAVLVPLGFGGLTSIARFTAVLFPIFLWLSQRLRGRIRTAVFILFGIGQILAAAAFYTSRPMF